MTNKKTSKKVPVMRRTPQNQPPSLTPTTQSRQVTTPQNQQPTAPPPRRPVTTPQNQPPTAPTSQKTTQNLTPPAPRQESTQNLTPSAPHRQESTESPARAPRRQETQTPAPRRSQFYPFSLIFDGRDVEPSPPPPPQRHVRVMSKIPEQSPFYKRTGETEEESDEEFIQLFTDPTDPPKKKNTQNIAYTSYRESDEEFVQFPNPPKKKNTRNIAYTPYRKEKSNNSFYERSITPIRQERSFSRPERTDESKYNLLQKFIWFSN